MRLAGAGMAAGAAAPQRTAETEDLDLKKTIPYSTAQKYLIPDPSQPIYVEGYHRPSASHPDDAVYEHPSVEKAWEVRNAWAYPEAVVHDPDVHAQMTRQLGRVPGIAGHGDARLLQDDA